MMNLISLEMITFITIMIAYSKFRKTNIFALNMVRDLTIYMPPNQGEYDQMVNASKPKEVRESVKGKKNKYDAKKASSSKGKQPLKFPLRQMPMGEELLSVCHKWFPEFDFILMMVHYVLILFVLMMAYKSFLPENFVKTNLTFNMALLTLLIICTSMTKNTFPTGYFSLTDETKMQLLLSFKSFLIVWCCFAYTEG